MWWTKKVSGSYEETTISSLTSRAATEWCTALWGEVLPHLQFTPPAISYISPQQRAQMLVEGIERITFESYFRLNLYTGVKLVWFCFVFLITESDEKVMECAQ